jgi:hypothetical protein
MGGPNGGTPRQELDRGGTTVETNTRLETLPLARARTLLDDMRRAHREPNGALAVDGEGRVLGVVRADDPVARPQLVDFDVHA